MSSIINSAVMAGLLSATSHVKMSEFATGLQSIYKSQGNEEAAARAMSFANQYRDKAEASADATGEALAESVKKVREEKELEQEMRLEEKRAINRAEEKAAQEAERAGATPAENEPQPAIIVELSQEYQAYRDKLQNGDIHDIIVPQDSMPQPTANISLPQTTAHTPLAPVSGFHSGATLVTAGAQSGLVLDIQI